MLAEEQPSEIINSSKMKDGFIETNETNKCKIFWCYRPAVWMLILGIFSTVLSFFFYGEKHDKFPIVLLGPPLTLYGIVLICVSIGIRNMGWKIFGMGLAKFFGIIIAIPFAIILSPFLCCWALFQCIVGKEYYEKPIKNSCYIFWRKRPSTLLFFISLCIIGLGIGIFFLLMNLTINTQSNFILAMTMILPQLLLIFTGIIWLYAGHYSGKEWPVFKDDLEKRCICCKEKAKSCSSGIVSLFKKLIGCGPACRKFCKKCGVCCTKIPSKLSSCSKCIINDVTSEYDEGENQKLLSEQAV